MPASPLDLTAIRQGQTAARHARHKRERLAREAREAVAAARAREDQARGLLAQVCATLSQARRAYRDAVERCSPASCSGGHEMVARVRLCDLAAGRVAEQQIAEAEARQALARASAEAERLAQEAARAQRRVERADEQVQAWRQREQSAREMHADLALEDDPPRVASTPSRRIERPPLPSAGARGGCAR